MALWEVDESRGMHFRLRHFSLAVLTRGLLVKAHVVVLFQTGGAVEELAGRTAIFGACVLQIAVPTLAQSPHVVFYSLAKLAPTVEGLD